METLLAAAEVRLKYLEDNHDIAIKAVEEVNSHALEPIVSSAVAERLQQDSGEPALILHRDHYTFASCRDGDIDGVVVGKMSGEDVIVFCEAKHNVNASVERIRDGLVSNRAKWQRLTDLEYSELVGNDRKDYQALQVAKYRDHKLVFAVGGTNFQNHSTFHMPRGTSVWLAVPFADAREGQAYVVE